MLFVIENEAAVYIKKRSGCVVIGMKLEPAMGG